MREKNKFIKMLSVLQPGTHEFVVKEVLYKSSGQWDDDMGTDVIFEATTGEIIIMSEEELREFNNIVSRHSVEEGMHLLKAVPEGNTSMFGLVSQTSR